MSFPVPPPEVPDPVLKENGWVSMKEQKETVSVGPMDPLEVEAYLYTKMYRDAELQREISEGTVGRIDRCFNVFFATRTHIEPEVDNLPLGVGRKQVTELAKILGRSEFEDRLDRRGVKDLRKVGSDSVLTETNKKVEMEEVRGKYDFSGTEVEIASDEGFFIQGGEIGLAGWIGAWHHDGDVFVAGGVYPTEDLERKIDVDLTDAVDVEIDVDLGIWPRPYKPELFSLVQSVR
jgi:hypothetical protein